MEEVRVMPHLGVPELLIILVIFMLIFGVGKLPEVGKALGQGGQLQSRSLCHQW